MKKILSSALLLTLLVAFALTLTSCSLPFFKKDMTDEIAGTYEMVRISGTVTYNGQTIDLEEDLYEYYRITLDEDGTCTVEAKGAGNTSKIENEGTWEYEDGTLEIKTETNGVTVVEEMEWEDDVITYDAKETTSGMTIKMHLVLEKQ